MTPERIDLCFSVFGESSLDLSPLFITIPVLLSIDEILPQLGIFQRIAKMLKNELYS
jgi:hypothetical protein